MTSSQTPLTQMSAVPTSKMATKSTLMTSSSTVAKSTMLKIKSFQVAKQEAELQTDKRRTKFPRYQVQEMRHLATNLTVFQAQSHSLRA